MKFLTTHKHLILALIVAIVLIDIVHKVVVHLDGVAHDQSVVAKSQVDADVEKTKILADQALKDIADMQPALKRLAVENANIQSSINALQLQLLSQIQKDSAMSGSDLRGRWSFLTGTTIPVSWSLDAPSERDAANKTVAKLEEVPILKDEANKKDTLVSDANTALAVSQKVIQDRENELNACKKTIEDSDTACKKQVAAVKDSARVSKSKWFLAGTVVGAVIKVVVKSLL